MFNSDVSDISHQIFHVRVEDEGVGRVERQAHPEVGSKSRNQAKTYRRRDRELEGERRFIIKTREY